MPTTRDEVEAYNFGARRQVLALLQGDETIVVDPRRRLNRSTFAGLLFAVVIVAAVGVAGYFSGGSSTSVPKDGVIVDSSTNGAYVVIDGILHPTLNLASAKLLAGNKVTSVTGAALAKLPRGLTVGIAHAPDALPPTSGLSHGAWTVCSIAPEASAARAQVVVTVGAGVPTAFGPADGLAVRSGDGRTWLLQVGMRYLVSDAAATLLGLDRSAQVAITSPVLNVIPEGPELVVPTVPGHGSAPTAQLPFTAQVGDLVEIDDGTGRVGRYVVMSDGVAPVDPFAFALLAGSAPKTLRLQASDIANAPRSTAPIPAQWPSAVPTLSAPPAPGAPLCITFRAGAVRTAAAWPVTISTPATPPLPPGGSPVSAKAGTLPAAATSVAVPHGSGALVRATGTGQVDGVFELLTDTGLRFPIADEQSVTRLGYHANSAVEVPVPFVSLLPAGPGLSAEAAGAEYAGQSAATASTSQSPPK